MQAAATSTTESVPQRSSKRSVVTIVRSLTARRQKSSYPRSQLRARDSSLQDVAIKRPGHPVGEETNKTEALIENTTSISRSSGEANRKNEQHASTSVYVVAQIDAKSDKEVTPPAGWEDLGVDVDKPALVASSSRDTIGSTERHIGAPDTRPAQSECERERPDIPKSHSLSVDINAGEKGRRASHGPINLKPQGKKHRIYRFIPAPVLRYIPGGSKIEKSTQAVSAQRQTIQPSSVATELPDSKAEELAQAASVPQAAIQPGSVDATLPDFKTEEPAQAVSISQPAIQPSSVGAEFLDSKTEGPAQAVSVPQPAIQPSSVDAKLLDCKTEEPAQAVSVPQPAIQLGSVDAGLLESKTKELTQAAGIPQPSVQPSSVGLEEKKLPPSPPSVKGDIEMMNTEDKEQTARESEEIERLRRDLSHSHHEVAELRKRCEAQSRDLESSNNFFSAPDKSSDSDIIHALQRLNAEIQQNTMYMAESLAEDFEFSDADTNLTKERGLAIQRASEHIGQVLVKSLGTKTPEDIPMLLQIAFQAYLASAFHQTVSSWASEPAHTAFIGGIYRRLRKVGEETKYLSAFLPPDGEEIWSTEAQAISGRWRALARVHIVHNCVSDSGPFVRGIITGLADILLAAGCAATQSDVISKVSSKFEERMALLVELAGRLNKLFDDVISSDFEVFIVHPGEKFEEKKMEDTDEDQIGIQEGPVLCATHLGLIKRIPVGSLWERGRKQKVMVLKVKVLLESFLNTEG